MSDPTPDDLDKLLAWMRAQHETAVIDQLAQQLEDDPVAWSGFPTPNTAHPALEQYAHAVRTWISQRLAPVRIPVLRRPVAHFRAPDEQHPEDVPLIGARTFYPCRLMAPAPFVGDPTQREARYLWTAMTDDLGRTITGPATLTWRDL